MVQSPRRHRPAASVSSPRYTRAKTLEELMREQGISGEAPDYRAIFSAVWPTKKDAAQFRRYIRSIRRPSRD
jgi:hypothetical protein